MSKVKQPRGNILNAALSILRKKGLPALSHTSVAEVSNISRQLVRYYFRSPDDMMSELCNDFCDELHETLKQALSQNKKKDNLETVFDVLLGPKIISKKGAFEAFMALSVGSKRIRTSLRGHFALLGNVLSHELSVAYPELGDEGSDALSYAVMTQIYGHWRMVQTLGFGAASHDRVVRNSIELMIEAHRSAAQPEKSSVEKIWMV